MRAGLFLFGLVIKYKLAQVEHADGKKQKILSGRLRICWVVSAKVAKSTVAQRTECRLWRQFRPIMMRGDSLN